jgi:hypothetical protein
MFYIVMLSVMFYICYDEYHFLIVTLIVVYAECHVFMC